MAEVYTPNTVTHHLYAYLRREDKARKNVDCQTTQSLYDAQAQHDSGVDTLDKDDRMRKFYDDYEQLHWRKQSVCALLHALCATVYGSICNMK